MPDIQHGSKQRLQHLVAVVYSMDSPDCTALQCCLFTAGLDAWLPPLWQANWPKSPLRDASWAATLAATCLAPQQAVDRNGSRAMRCPPSCETGTSKPCSSPVGKSCYAARRQCSRRLLASSPHETALPAPLIIPVCSDLMPGSLTAEAHAQHWTL